MNPAIIEKPRRAVKTRQKNRQIVGARHAVPANVSCTDAKNASGSKQNPPTTSTRYKLTVYSAPTARLRAGITVTLQATTQANRNRRKLQKANASATLQSPTFTQITTPIGVRVHLTAFPTQSSIVFSQLRAKRPQVDAAAICGRAGLQPRRENFEISGAFRSLKPILLRCRMNPKIDENTTPRLSRLLLRH